MMNFPVSDELEIRYRNLPHWELGGSIYFVTFNTLNKLELNPSARQIVFDSCLFFHSIGTYTMKVPHSRMNQAMREISSLGGKVAGVTLLGESQEKKTPSEPESRSRSRSRSSRRKR